MTGLHAVLVSVGLAVFALPATAQDILPRTPQDIATIARAFGTTSFTAPDTDGRPVLNGEIDDVLYSMVLYGCDNPDGCESVQFYASFISDNNTLEFVNQWNQDKRFVTAYIAEDGDAVIAMSVNVDFGVTRHNFIDAFDIWTNLLGQFNARIYGLEEDPGDPPSQPPPRK